MLGRSNIPRGSSQVQNSTFLLEQNLGFSRGRCVMPCLKQDLCVCAEREEHGELIDQLVKLIKNQQMKTQTDLKLLQQIFPSVDDRDLI